MARQGILANEGEQNFSVIDAAEYIGVKGDEYYWQEHYPILVAKKSVAHADALLTALDSAMGEERGD